MFQPRLTVLLALLLSALCWVGATTPAIAQPSLIASATELFSGGRPLLSFPGQRPTTLGVKDGQLAACPASPNCVSSQMPDADKEHSIAPLTYAVDPATAMANLKTVIERLPRTKIVTEAETYLYAEFTSALLGFVDDVEFYLDRDRGVIHVRSASRLGQSDLGVNRKRVEEIRTAFAALDT